LDGNARGIQGQILPDCVQLLGDQALLCLRPGQEEQQLRGFGRRIGQEAGHPYLIRHDFCGAHDAEGEALPGADEAAEGGDSRAELWLKNNVNNIIEPEAIPEVIFSNMRILNTINKIDVRGKLNINNAMGKTFDVTVQWDFWDFDRLYTGKELLVDTITASYEFTEWMDFRFGVFNYDSIRPHSSPNKHEGECIIRVHEKESKDIIGQVSIPCNVEFKLPLFGDPKVQCTNYIFNEPNN
jgi:hypothetical protein